MAGNRIQTKYSRFLCEISDISARRRKQAAACWVSGESVITITGWLWNIQVFQQAVELFFHPGNLGFELR